jgi:VIT1/CCC1 family predicted Fe2+/Mn2+ transporter
MKDGLRAGLNFGLTSGVITTLGLMVGLHSGTHSTLAVIGGILTIAIGDSMSDALGMHISKEGENVYSEKHLWVATLATLVSKFIVAGSFIIPVLVFELDVAILVSALWGLGILTGLSVYLARIQNTAVLKVVGEHVAIALLVIVLTHYAGVWVANMCV